MHAGRELAGRILSGAQKNQFVRNGFVKLDSEILWREVGCDPEDRRTWTRPVVRLGDCAQEPFRQAVNTTTLCTAFDELVGVGRWVPRTSLGGFPIRFPHSDHPADTGWHVDASFPPDRPVEAMGAHFDWRINLRSEGRALLMLFRFSDVDEQDAPTRIRVGSHLRIPRLLAPARDDGMSLLELARLADPETADLQEANRDRRSGNGVFMSSLPGACTQPHRGIAPRFLAQPPLYPRTPLQLRRRDGDYSLVEQAIRLGLNDRRAA
jgi:hypothetical protein